MFDLDVGAEIAAELDPAQLTAEWAKAAARQGLNRASLGVQDLSPSVQAAVNRIELVRACWSAPAEHLRQAGISSLNFDLMYGLPRQRVEDVLNTLDQVLPLDPARIALFGYAHVPWMRAHQRLLPEADLPGAVERLHQSEVAAERLVAEGYVGIGMDHFARPDDSMAIALAQGTLRRNFQGYTTDQAATLLGFGASAISQLPQGYAQNHASELLWREAVAHARLPTARGVTLSDDDRFRGEVIERLMCDFAVDLADVADRHGRGTADLAPAMTRLSVMEADGLVNRCGDRVQVTELGRPFVRSVCAAFDAYLDPSAVRHSRVVPFPPSSPSPPPPSLLPPPLPFPPPFLPPLPSPPPHPSSPFLPPPSPPPPSPLPSPPPLLLPPPPHSPPPPLFPPPTSPPPLPTSPSSQIFLPISHLSHLPPPPQPPPYHITTSPPHPPAGSMSSIIFFTRPFPCQAGG